ncbi:MAG TPA: FKBP-type peptidyl-prolyl cis-trans isomerase [Candidatus Saccharimonadales bacterium]|nr:FKBP-type peptidyl-prolyl cis-trans isomerase [Candidatus Saccharimonadales bacterium]
MAQRGQRVFAGFFAVLFLITSSALTVLVIWTLANQNNGSSSNNQTNTNNTNTSNNKTATNAAGTKLAGFTPVSSVPVLKETDLQVGTGPTVKSGDNVTVNYTGAVASTGIIFQSTETSGGQPVPLSLNNVITGWKLGIPGMKVGGTRQLLIPAGLAYGASPPPNSGIPANADLVFNVTVEKIN